MGHTQGAISGDQQILNTLSRIERKLDDIERPLKAVEQDVGRVKRAVKA